MIWLFLGNIHLWPKVEYLSLYCRCFSLARVNPLFCSWRQTPLIMSRIIWRVPPSLEVDSVCLPTSTTPRLQIFDYQSCDQSPTVPSFACGWWKWWCPWVGGLFLDRTQISHLSLSQFGLLFTFLSVRTKESFFFSWVFEF